MNLRRVLAFSIEKLIAPVQSRLRAKLEMHRTHGASRLKAGITTGIGGTG